MQASFSLPPEYAILPMVYPDDIQAYLDMLEDAFSKDSMTIYIRASIRNPATLPLRRHMRRAGFKNTIEKLTPGVAGTESLFMKLVHLPTGAIVGGSGWQIPGHAATKSESQQTSHETPAIAENMPIKTPYPLLPPGSEIPAEDSALSSIGPAMSAAMEELSSRIPILGSLETRNKSWWYLASLGVSYAHQGRHLGQIMVQQGLERAIQDAADRPELCIKGVWLISTEAGRKTYEKAGFTPIATARVVYGDGKGGIGIQTFYGEDARTAEGPGQDFVAFIKEFER